MAQALSRPQTLLALALVFAACRPEAGPAIDVARRPLSPAAPTISPEIVTDAPVSGFSQGLEDQVAAAYGQSSYLVVWSDRRSDGFDIAPAQSTGSDIYGIRVAADGTVLDTTSFPIAVVGGDQLSPMVVFDGTDWVVVWSDGRASGSNTSTWGARVAQDGTVRDPQGFAIDAGGTSGAHYPVGLDFDGTHVVVSVARPNGIYANVIQSDGTPVGAAFQLAAQGSAGGALAFDGTNHLVLYGRPSNPQPPSGSSTDMVVQRFSSAGTLVGAPIPVLTGVLTSTVGLQTAAASNGSGWLVAWVINSIAYYAFVHDDGTSSTAVNFGGSAVHVSVDYTTSGSTILYTTPTTYHARQLNAQGTVTIADKILFTQSQQPAAIALAHDPSGEILAYVNSYNLFGTRLSPALAIVDSPGFLLSSMANLQADPAVAWNGSEYLLAWTDLRLSPNGGTTPATYATRVTPAGQVLDAAGSQLATVTSWTSAASNGSNFSISATSYGLLAVPVSAAGAAGTGVGLTPTSGNGTIVSHVASDGSNYLVVWINAVGLPSVGPLTGSRLGPTGQLLDATPIAIGSNAIESALAFNGTSYLVAFYQLSGTISAVRVGTNGQLLDSTPKTIGTRTTTASGMAVASDGAGWLVVWTDNHGMRGARVDGSGQVLDSSGINIASGTVIGSDAAAAWDGRRYWVIWLDARTIDPLFSNSSPELDLYGARVTSGGTVDDPGGILISGGRDHIAPAIAGGDHQIMVAYYRMVTEPPFANYRVRERLVTDLSPDGEGCAKPADCQSNICNGTCQPVPTGSDGGGGSDAGAGGATGAGGSGGAGAGGRDGGSDAGPASRADGGGNGGATGSGGGAGTGGAAGGSGGASGGSGGASGGSGGAAGSAGDAGTTSDARPTTSGSSSGCSCTTGRADDPRAASAFLAALCLGLILRRRRVRG
jgi:MYXO-CTERM domain-containing protein